MYTKYKYINFLLRTSQGTLAMDLVDNASPGRKLELDVRRRVELEGAELEEYLRTQGEKLNRLIVKQDVEEESSSDSDDDIEMSVITGKHDIVVRPEGRHHSGFFKSNKKHYAMFPFHEEKIKCDEYGEIINLEDYRISEMGFETTIDENNKENIKKEEPKESKTNTNGINNYIIIHSKLNLTRFLTNRCSVVGETHQMHQSAENNRN